MGDREEAGAEGMAEKQGMQEAAGVDAKPEDQQQGAGSEEKKEGEDAQGGADKKEEGKNEENTAQGQDEADGTDDLDDIFDDDGGGGTEASASKNTAEQHQGSGGNKPSGPFHSDDEDEDEEEQAKATVTPTSADNAATANEGPTAASAEATAAAVGEESRKAATMDESPDEPATAQTTANALFGDVSEDEEGDEEQAARMHGNQQSPMASAPMDMTEDRPPPPQRTPVSAPCGAGRVGKRVFLAKLPNFISIDPRGYDPDTLEAEEDGEGQTLMDDLGRRRVKLGAENTIRWRPVGDRLESNARLVKWSDGSVSLVLGDEVHDCVMTDLTSAGPVQQLLVKRDDGTGYEARAPFEQRMTFRATSLGSRTQQRLMSRAKSHSKAVRRTKTAVVSENPEKLKQQAIKEEQAAIRQRNKELRKRRKVTQLTADQLEMGASMDMGTSINAVKQGYFEEDEEDEYEEDDDNDFIEEVEEAERREQAPARPQRRRLALSDDEDDDDE